MIVNPLILWMGKLMLGKLNNLAECPWVVNVRTQALSPAKVSASSREAR